MVPLSERLAVLINAGRWDERRRLLESDPELYSPAADTILAGWIEDLGIGAHGTNDLQDYRVLLAQCSQDGPAETMDLLAVMLAREAIGQLDSNVPEAVESGMIRLTDAAATVSRESPLRTIWCIRLASAFFARFRTTGDLDAIDTGILVLERAEQSAGPDADELPALLNNLTDGLLLRYDATGVGSDLAAALAACRRGARPDRDDEAQWALLTNTSRVLRALAAPGETELLDEAVAVAEEAAARNRDGSLAAVILAELGHARLQRHRERGDPADLDLGLDAFSESLRRTPPESPRRWTRQFDVAMALLERYDRTADITDVESAIEALDQAAAACPPESPHRAAIATNTGLAIAERWERTRTPGDLDAAVAAFEQAVQLGSPAYPAWSNMLGNLGGGLLDRYREGKHPGDLDRSLDCFTRAIAEGRRPGWRENAADQHNLGWALLERHLRDGATGDLDRAVEALRTAVDLTPGTSPLLAGWLGALAIALARRHEAAGAEADRQEASEVFRAACGHAENADTATLLRTAIEWGRWARGPGTGRKRWPVSGSR